MPQAFCELDLPLTGTRTGRFLLKLSHSVPSPTDIQTHHNTPFNTLRNLTKWLSWEMQVTSSFWPTMLLTYPTQTHPSTGITPPKSQPMYQTYKSPHGPKYVLIEPVEDTGEQKDWEVEDPGNSVLTWASVAVTRCKRTSEDGR